MFTDILFIILKLFVFCQIVLLILGNNESKRKM